MSLSWKIDECCAYHDRLLLRGWCAHSAPGAPIVGVAAVFPASTAGQAPTVVPVGSFGRPSPDVAAAVDPAATHARFDELLPAPPDALGHDFTLRFTLADGTVLTSSSALGNAIEGDPFFASFGHFLEHLHRLPPGGTVLEIGSRARSAVTRRQHIPAHLDYLGLDILPGPNVDLVGDAHELSALLGERRFVAAMSFSVFEHLAMPWKVVLELNRVLAPGGLVFTQTHQTWPLHEEPWDFWRFSRHSWQTLFNPATGFEVVEAVSGDPAHIHACFTNPVTHGLAASRDAHLGSASIARKVSATTLSWPVPVATAARDMYPAGELSSSPLSATVPFQRG